MSIEVTRKQEGSFVYYSCGCVGYVYPIIESEELITKCDRHKNYYRMPIMDLMKKIQIPKLIFNMDVISKYSEKGVYNRKQWDIMCNTEGVRP